MERVAVVAAKGGELDREISSLALRCQVRIFVPVVVRREVQKASSVCGTNSPAAVAKPYELLAVHWAIRETRGGMPPRGRPVASEDYIVERLRKSFPDLRGKRPPV